MDPLKNINLRATPQTERADPRQTRNHAGGYSFTVTPREQLRRFLINGVEGGTFYVKEHQLTRENATVVTDFARNHHSELLAEILAVSLAGRAPRQNPTLFALAAACTLGDEEDRRTAFEALPRVARTATHLFTFFGYLRQMRGLGRQARRGIADWYSSQDLDALTYQMVKYRNRVGLNHRHLLKGSHDAGYTAVREGDTVREQLYRWACRAHNYDLNGLAMVEGYQRASGAPVKLLPGLIREYGLTREMVPEHALDNAGVWEALLDNGMPQEALIRNLAVLTRLGLLTPLGGRAAQVTAQITDERRLRGARMHPMKLLVALRTYAAGAGARGRNMWKPQPQIVDALDAAFYTSFGTIEPAGKRTLLAVDVSGSMGWGTIAGLPITPREAAGALAMTVARTEPAWHILGFSDRLVELAISPRQRLDDALAVIDATPMGGTDCAAPMLWAIENKAQVDTFIVITDSETWAGRVQPHEALRRYRERVNPAAKLVVVGTDANPFSLADPTDTGMLDVVGMDSAVPQLITEFSRT